MTGLILRGGPDSIPVVKKQDKTGTAKHPALNPGSK
jgi:hypothetical protein